MKLSVYTERERESGDDVGFDDDGDEYYIQNRMMMQMTELNV